MKNLISLLIVLISFSTIADPICSTTSPGVGVHVVGIYESPIAAGFDENTFGEATVNLAGEGPMILVLSSYNPTSWKIKKSPEIALRRVILNGYHKQRVTGVPNSIVSYFVYDINQKYIGNFPYSSSGIEYSKFQTELARIVFPPIASFQGAYRAPESQFEVANCKNKNNLSCATPNWDWMSSKSCSGPIVAYGNMENHDDGAYAKGQCEASGVRGTCCMFHLYGKGEWYLTTGTTQDGPRVCNSLTGSDCRAAAACE